MTGERARAFSAAFTELGREPRYENLAARMRDLANVAQQEKAASADRLTDESFAALMKEIEKAAQSGVLYLKVQRHDYHAGVFERCIRHGFVTRIDRSSTQVEITW